MSDSDAGLINTRFLMSASAAYMALVGLTAALFEEELLAHFGAATTGFPTVLVGVVAGLYLGFAVLNWMARGNLIGGVYSRPVALGNFAHFLGVAIILLQQVPATSHTLELGVTAGLNSIFAATFGYVVFGQGGSCG